MLKSTLTGVMNVSGAVAFTACVWAMAACDAASTPSQPSPVITQAPPGIPTDPPSLVLFTNDATAFSTADVYDVQGRIVRFNTAGELIWTGDDTRYTSGKVIVGTWVEPLFRFPVMSGNYVGQADYCLASVVCAPLMVHFGTMNGERRAYLTLNPSWFHAGSMMTNIDVEGGTVVITATSMQVSEGATTVRFGR